MKVIDRDKTIQGLFCCGCYDRSCRKCPYGTNSTDFNCLTYLCTDALALLVAYEPRVLSEYEARHYADGEMKDAYSEKPPLYVEYKKEPLPYRIKWATLETVYYWMNDFEISLDYGKEFRFWTAKPNSEQSAAVPWEVTENG